MVITLKPLSAPLPSRLDPSFIIHDLDQQMNRLLQLHGYLNIASMIRGMVYVFSSDGRVYQFSGETLIYQNQVGEPDPREQRPFVASCTLTSLGRCQVLKLDALSIGTEDLRDAALPELYLESNSVLGGVRLDLPKADIVRIDDLILRTTATTRAEVLENVISQLLTMWSIHDSAVDSRFMLMSQTTPGMRQLYIEGGVLPGARAAAPVGAPTYALGASHLPALRTILTRYTKDVDGTDPSGIISLLIRVYDDIITGELAEEQLVHYDGQRCTGVVPVWGSTKDWPHTPKPVS